MKATSHRRRSGRLVAACFEALEDRRLFNITVTGTNGPDVINVSQSGVSINVTVNGVTKSYGNQPVFSVTVNALGGNDSVSVSEIITIPTYLYGGNGHDYLKGGKGNDTLDGGGGTDLLRGSYGNDLLYGQSGDDTLLGGFGNDTLYGGHGNDKVDGEQDNDYVNGNGQPDIVVGTTASVGTYSTARTTTTTRSLTFVGGTKAASLKNTSSVFYSDNDIVRGGDGNDTVDGAGGADAVYGDGGNDVVYGGAGNDRLYGGGGNNLLVGGDGDDVLVTIGGGTGDRLWGQKGFDSYWLDDARLTELLMDAEPAEMAGSNTHFVAQFEVNVTRHNGQTYQERPTKTLVGQNLRDPIAEAPYVSYRNRPLFGPAGPKMDDVRQGEVGDCYFLAGLSSVARTNANRIRQAVVDLGDGTFAVRFRHRLNASSVYYRVDGDLPAANGSLKYAKLGHGNSVWVAVLEKAFAYHRWFDGGTYKLLESGTSHEAFRALGMQVADFWGLNGVNTLHLVSQQLNLGRAVIASTLHTKANASLPYIEKHQYVVHGVNLGNNTITVRNPWGYDGAGNDANPNDGYYTYTAAQFQAYFKNATWAIVN